MPAPAIFISFRTDDEPFAATLIDHTLSDRFGADQVFRSSRSIRAGDDFDTVIRTVLRRCDVLLAVIGPRWLSAADGTGRRRLHQRDDWVRREIRTALREGTRVVPVLLNGAARPRVEDLPADLADLARKQTLRLAHRHAPQDLDHLVEQLTGLVPELRAPTAPGSTVHTHQGDHSVSSVFTGTVHADHAVFGIRND